VHEQGIYGAFTGQFQTIKKTAEAVMQALPAQARSCSAGTVEIWKLYRVAEKREI
jgi:hypothetical protein